MRASARAPACSLDKPQSGAVRDARYGRQIAAPTALSLRLARRGAIYRALCFWILRRRFASRRMTETIPGWRFAYPGYACSREGAIRDQRVAWTSRKAAQSGTCVTGGRLPPLRRYQRVLSVGEAICFPSPCKMPPLPAFGHPLPQGGEGRIGGLTRSAVGWVERTAKPSISPQRTQRNLFLQTPARLRRAPSPIKITSGTGSLKRGRFFFAAPRLRVNKKVVIASEAKQSSDFPLRTFSGLLRFARNDATFLCALCVSLRSLR